MVSIQEILGGLNWQSGSERFSGHESFICRYGWLPKAYNAVLADPLVFKDEAKATVSLGVGRNMVKSLQFWGLAFGIISFTKDGGWTNGPMGDLLLSEKGWDPFLEQSESLWLLHWWISTHANVAAWNLVFGKSALSRFDRRALIAALDDRATLSGKKLASSTLEQHAGILLNTYRREQSATDDASWSPFQDLGLFDEAATDDGKSVYLVGRNAPLGLSPRVFLFSLADFFSRNDSNTLSLNSLVYAEFSPGAVYRLDEYQVRLFLDAVEDQFPGVLRFVDTADTQQIIFEPSNLPKWAAFVAAMEDELNV